MKIILFLFLSVSLLFSACGDDKEGTTPNGYKYVKHISTGGVKPDTGDYAYVHVYIRHDDSLVNSTRDMGKTIPVPVTDLSKLPEDQKGPGKANPITDAISVMSVGDSVTIFIPMDERLKAAPQLQGVEKLTYDVVLVEVKNKEEYQTAMDEERKKVDEKIEALKTREPEVATMVADIVKQYKAGDLKDKLNTTESGLKYMVIEEGTGEQAQAGAPVQVQYYGVLPSGEMFDNSFMRGRPFNFTLGQGQVIPGWDQGIAMLKEGSKAVLFIPAELGYGAAGTGKIPPNSELIFYVELEKPGM